MLLQKLPPVISGSTEPSWGNAVAGAARRYKSTAAIVTMTSGRISFYTSGRRAVASARVCRMIRDDKE